MRGRQRHLVCHRGWWLTLVHILSGILLCLTIIGIPVGLATSSSSRWARPIGREIVSVEEGRAEWAGSRLPSLARLLSRPDRLRRCWADGDDAAWRRAYLVTPGAHGIRDRASVPCGRGTTEGVVDFDSA